jgi:hypothetical protein
MEGCFILTFHMLPRKTFHWLLLLLAVAAPFASLHAGKPVYSKGKLIDIQKKTREKVDMYLVNTPVTSAVPYFQIVVELGATDYTAEFAPRHDAEELPEAWKAGEPVPCRVVGRRLFLQRPEGTEMQWIVTKKTAVDAKKSE